MTEGKDNTQRQVRRAEADDIEQVLDVFEAARRIMAESGNPRQWRNGYPTADHVSEDIRRQGAYVIEEEGRVVAYFAMLPSPEPTYAVIYDGQWLDDQTPYLVVHRIASLPDAHGIFRQIIGFCLTRSRNIRIDTHRDNRIMQHNLLKHGFSYCGIIHLASGDERLAYQKLDA